MNIYSSTDGRLLLYIYIFSPAFFYWNERGLSANDENKAFFIHFSCSACAYYAMRRDEQGRLRTRYWRLPLSLSFRSWHPPSTVKKMGVSASMKGRTANLLYSSNDRRVLEVNCFVFYQTTTKKRRNIGGKLTIESTWRSFKHAH